MDRRYFIGGSDAQIIMGDDDAALLRPQCRSSVIDKSMLALPEARRVRDHEHVRHVTQQPCLICGRRPSDAHHLRFAQSRALSRKVSDEFTVPLCRGHHREVHRSGDEAAWWEKAGIDPTVVARALWLETHPLPTNSTSAHIKGSTSVAAGHARRGRQPRKGVTIKGSYRLPKRSRSR